MNLPDFNDDRSQSSCRPPEPYAGVDACLGMRFETSAIWPKLQKALSVNEAGAAISLDLYAEALTGGRYTSYSRRKDHYAKHAAGRKRWQKRDALYTFSQILPAVDALENAGLIDHVKALSGTRNWQSKMRAKPMLVDAVRDLVRNGLTLTAHRPSAGLVLRDAAGEQIAFRETAKTKRIERNLEALNQGFASVRLEGAFPACAVRICNQSLERGGRFYLEGGSIQIRPEEERLRVTWDGEPSGEVDYKTMHVSVLYSDAGIAPPDDAYTIPRFPRSLCKMAVLAVINAPTYYSALGAIAQDDEMGSLAVPGSDEAKRVAADLIAALKRLHRPIATFFHSGVGAFLMRRESDILEDVMLTMQAKGTIVLPIHDSGLCPVSAVPTLEQVMIESAEKAGLRHVKIETTRASNDT